MLRLEQVFYGSVVPSKKGSRVWLEGQKLANCGFKPGKKYNLKYDHINRSIELSLNNSGDKIVSKKNRYNQEFPVIDLCNQEITSLFPEGSLIVARVVDKTIKISLHQVSVHKKEREARLLDRLMNRQSLIEGSLCSGGGISSHAIHTAFKEEKINSDVVLLADLDPRYLQVANRSFPKAMIHEGKLEDVMVEDIPQLDILSFSLPCTGHSPQGKTKNKIKLAEEHSEAGTAIFGAVKYIVYSNPSIIISENVVQAQSSATYVLLKAELKRLGYNIKEFILDDTHAGSLEKRKRYWFVAVSRGLDLLSSLEPMKFKKEHKNIKDILESDEKMNWFDATYFDKRQEKNDANGRGFKKNFVQSSDESVGVITRNYTKRQISNPHYIKGEKIRLFSLKEHARIKGIPDNLLDGVADTVGHEILGQSILYNHARGLIRALAQKLKSLK